MSNISDLRDTADYLFEIGKFDEAFVVYDEITRQVWAAIGSIQTGLAEFSYDYLNQNIRSAIEFRREYNILAANTIFIKWFNLDIDQTLNEFIFSLSGHLKCLAYSQKLINKYKPSQIYVEYLVLYNLILHSTNEKWLSNILKIASPQMNSSKLKSLRTNLPEATIKRMLIETSSKINTTDWRGMNLEIFNYMSKVGEIHSDLFIKIKEIVGPFSSTNNYQQRQSDKKQKYQKYERYEKYEKYERYEKYEQKHNEEKHSRTNHQSFNVKDATEVEKSKHYGRVLGLQGKVTKGQIRKKYLEMMSKYHPDKVENLGKDLIELAEEKTKQINEAYEWLKIKFKL